MNECLEEGWILIKFIGKHKFIAINCSNWFNMKNIFERMIYILLPAIFLIITISNKLFL